MSMTMVALASSIISGTGGMPPCYAPPQDASAECYRCYWNCCAVYLEMLGECDRDDWACKDSVFLAYLNALSTLCTCNPRSGGEGTAMLAMLPERVRVEALALLD